MDAFLFFLIGPLLQDGPYGGTASFQKNFFFGGGIGLWFLFFLLALGGLIWISYEIQRRKLDAPAWKILSYIALGLLLPAVIFKLTVTEAEVNLYYDIKDQIAKLERYQEGDWIDQVDALEDQLTNAFPPLTGLIEPIIYLGIIGGIGGAGLSAAFHFNFQGQVGSAQSIDPVSRYPQTPPPPPPPPSRPGRSRSAPRRSSKPKANAWLVARDGKSYQLFQGETVIGRQSACEIQIIGDTTMSKQHAKIVESNGHFKLYDLGSTNGTRVNKRRLHQPVMLDPDDDVQLGDNTFLKFIKS